MTTGNDPTGARTAPLHAGAYERGWKFCMRGGSPFDCPFARGSHESRSWHVGYNDAMQARLNIGEDL